MGLAVASNTAIRIDLSSRGMSLSSIRMELPKIRLNQVSYRLNRVSHRMRLLGVSLILGSYRLNQGS